MFLRNPRVRGQEKLSRFDHNIARLFGEDRCALIRLLIALGRTIWIADEHRSDGKRFVMRADEKLKKIGL
jgi:hypothetical protein